MMSEYKVEKYYLSSASANNSSSLQQNTAQQNAKLLKNNQDTSTSTSSQNNHKTTLVVNIQKKMNKVQMFTYRILNIVKDLFMLATIFLQLMRFKQFNQLLVGIPQGDNLNQMLDESHFNFQSFYCYAILAYVCQKILGKKIVQGKLVVIKDLGIQIETSTLDGKQSKRFLDISRYLTFFSVGQYLAIIVEKEKKLVLPYPSFDLRLQELVPIYQEVKQLLSNNQ
eukprot:403373428